MTDKIMDPFNRADEEEKALVKRLGSLIGYGNMMDLAGKCWEEVLTADYGISGSSFRVGPCVSGTTTCICVDAIMPGISDRSGCDHCEGCGWLTKKVKLLVVLYESEKLIAADEAEKLIESTSEEETYDEDS